MGTDGMAPSNQYIEYIHNKRVIVFLERGYPIKLQPSSITDYIYPGLFVFLKSNSSQERIFAVKLLPEWVLITDGYGWKWHGVHIVLLDRRGRTVLEVLRGPLHRVEDEHPDGRTQHDEPEESA